MMSSKAPSSPIAGAEQLVDEIAHDFERLVEGKDLDRRSGGRPSVRSRIALDLVNLLQANAAAAVGPFLAVYLTGHRHWGPAAIGVAISVQGIAALLAQLPAGALVDSTSRKRALMAAASLTIGIGSLAITFATSLVGVVLAQLMIGVAGAMVPLLVTALSLGLVGRERLPRRIGRNQAFDHGGSVIAAILTGAVGGYVSGEAVFYLMSIASLGTAAAAMWIRERDIDHKRAREGKGEKDEDSPIAPLRSLLRHEVLLRFALTVFLFQMCNAAVLPLVGQMLSRQSMKAGAIYIAWSIVAGQLVMIPVAVFAGLLCSRYGRKPVMTAGFAVLPLYAIACALISRPYVLVGLQSLGGITSGILSVVAIIIVNDLARGTGRFNLLAGLLFVCMSLGPSIGSLLAGMVAHSAGFPRALMMLAAVGALALALFVAFVPETGRRK